VRRRLGCGGGRGARGGLFHRRVRWISTATHHQPGTPPASRARTACRAPT